MANENKTNRPAQESQNGNGSKNGSTGLKPAANRPVTTPAKPTPGQRRLTPKQEAARRRAQQRQRTQLLVIGGLIVVVAIAAIIIGISVSQPLNWQDIPAQATTDQIPYQLGPSDAKVTVEEYGDYQCPACKYWHDTNQQNFINSYVTTNKVKFVFHNMPFLDQSVNERDSHQAAEAAACAADQKRFWDYHNALYNNQKAEHSGFWTIDHLKDLAKALKLNTDTFNSCIDSNKYRSQINQSLTDATNRGVNSTPSFFVNNVLVTGSDNQASADYSVLQSKIDAALSSNTTTPGATPGTTPNK